MAQQKALFLQTPVNGEWHVGLKVIPKPGSGELVVKIHATALNPVEWKIRAFNFLITDYPATLGLDSTGTVEAVGEGVQGFAKGNRVLHSGSFSNINQLISSTRLFPQRSQRSSLPTFPLMREPRDSSNRSVRRQAVGIPRVHTCMGDKWQRPVQRPAYRYYWWAIVCQTICHPTRETLRLFTHYHHCFGAQHRASRISGCDVVVDRNASDVSAKIAKIRGGSSVKIVFDAVSQKETQTQGWDLLASGRHARAAARAADRSGDVQGQDNCFSAGKRARPHARALGLSLYSKVTALLEDGSIKPNHVEVLPGGLAGIPDGLECLKSGNVSGKKLIARPQETA